MPSSPACTCLSCPAHDRVQNTPCPVYPTSSITDAQWAVLEPLLPPPGNTAGRGGRPEKHSAPAGPGRDLLPGPRRYRLGGAAARTSRHTRPSTTCFGRWARQGVWQQIHDALRDLVRVARGTRPAAHRGDHRLPVGARRGHRARHDPRLRRGQEGQRPQTPHRRGHRRAAARGRGHHRRHPGPRRRAPAADRSCAAGFPRSAWSGPTAATPGRLVDLGPQGPGTDRRGRQTHRRRARASPCCPAAGSSSAHSPGSANTAAASATTRHCPPTTKPWSTSP